MRVLITGGCGFVGANLIHHLGEVGEYRVSVVDNEVLGRRAFLAGYDVEFTHGDIRDAELMDRLVQDKDAVVHLAADTRVIPSIEAPRFNFDNNVVGSLNVLDAVRRSGRARLITASTGGAIIGEAEPPVHEDMLPRPMSPYGASKLAVEGYCSAYAASYGLDIAALRFSNVYGPRSFHKGSVVAAFFRQILKGDPLTVHGDGSQTRDYVYAPDLARGIVNAMTRPVSGVFQLGSGRPVTIDELIDAMRQVVAPRPVTVHYQAFRDGEVRATWCDISKARRDLAFEPATSLLDGLAQTWEWFLSREGQAT